MSKVIKMKLLELDKKQVDFIPELRKRGINTNTGELSTSINGKLNTPKGERIRKECLYILDEWSKGVRA